MSGPIVLGKQADSIALHPKKITQKKGIHVSQVHKKPLNDGSHFFACPHLNPWFAGRNHQQRSKVDFCWPDKLTDVFFPTLNCREPCELPISGRPLRTRSTASYSVVPVETMDYLGLATPLQTISNLIQVTTNWIMCCHRECHLRQTSKSARLLEKFTVCNCYFLAAFRSSDLWISSQTEFKWLTTLR